MPLSQSSLAAANAVGVQNVQFQSAAKNLPRKILVIGTYDPLITTITDNVPVLVTSPADAGNKFGFGYMIHRLVTQVFEGSQGVECWVIPQSETGAAAIGDIDFVGSVATEAGTLYLYVAGLPVPVTILKADDADAVATAVAAAVTADKNLPVTAVVNGVTTSQVDFTAKSEGPEGDNISLTFNWGFQEDFPAGVTAAVTDMTGGSGVPVIANALNGLGTGDDANEDFFTDMVHGYGQDTTSLDAISAYVGEGNDFVGLYLKTVARPFRSLVGDVATGSAGLTALLALGNGRKLDRANGVIAVPGSPNHPSEIAALAIGIMARLNNDRAAESYNGKLLPNIIPGARADRWTSDYDDRDTAVKAGVSPTAIDNNAVLMQNVLTFYHPDSIADSSNGYRSQRNISIIQNLLYNLKNNFGQEKWQGISIVDDIAKVSNITDRQKARDTNSVLDDLLALANSFEGHAWIFSAAFTISKLQEGGYISIRAGGTGFDIILPIVLSGEGSIINTTIQFDTSLAVLLG
jgi:phage tail sheath gpL-like